MIGEPRVIATLARSPRTPTSRLATWRRASPASGAGAGCSPPQIERLKALYAPRLDACLAGLDTHMPDAEATHPEGGFFVSITLPDGS